MKLDDALRAYRTAYENPMVKSPYKMVYGKAWHLPLKLEHKAYWVIKELNYHFKLAGEKMLFDISSLMNGEPKPMRMPSCLKKS